MNYLKDEEAENSQVHLDIRELEAEIEQKERMIIDLQVNLNSKS